MVTLSDVAARAGVSVSAVSRVLSDAPSARVSEHTRQRIKEIAAELDYRPNFAGRALKLARSNVIALIVPDLTNAVFTELMEGVEDEALANDYLVLLGRAEGMQPGGDTIRKLIGEGRVDGLLVQLADTVTPADVQQLVDGPAPVVFINSIEPGHSGSVALQDALGARLGTQHLIDLGHRRIGLVGGSPSSYTAQQRRAGFLATLADAGLTARPDHLLDLGYAPEDGKRGLETIMATPDPPTAVFVANVNAAIGVLSAARTLGIRVPQDLSVAAMHDAWTVENSWPPLTTVKMPLYDLGRRGFRAIHDRLLGREVADIVVDDRPPELILRESTAPPSR
ncbi:LacI family DNA-binding transcriptional regulator [Cryobacterium soli]|uniref:LacI family DNA-binding transcriptional regulator n=1 Tax=Cryobacterium soli TaxID=2220095 RepID=UPI000E737662|nr:LacI family DNA-binding transcriptional regulator [Cryobacterium soli]